MKTSTDRILTTHTGSLPRPKPLIDLVLRREKGEAIAADAFEGEVVKAVDEIVAQQVAAGIDVVSDGEMSKPSYTTYIRHRVSGIEMDPRAAEKGRDIMIGRDLLQFPDFARQRSNFSRHAVSRLRRRVALQGPFRARPRSRASESRGGEIQAGRGVHDRAVAGNSDALHHQPALPDRGGLCRRARRRAQGRIPRHRRSRLRAADRCARPRLGAQQPIPPSQRRRIPLKNRRAQYRGAQRRDRRPARRPHAAAHLLGQLRGPAHPRSAGDQDHRHCLQSTRAGVQHRGRQSAPRPRMGRPQGDQNPRRQNPHPRRHQLDDEFRRAPAAGRAAHRPLRASGRSRAADRRRRLRLWHRGAHRADGGRLYRLGKTRRAQRRRRDRQQETVGGVVSPFT